MLTERGGREGRSSRFAQGLFSPLPQRYDRLAELLSFGQNGRWRREMVGHALADNPACVLDVATGPGGVALQMARRSSARIVGLDVTESMLAAAARAVERESLSERIALVRATAEGLPFPDASFDALTFTYLLRYVPDPAAVLAELARVVRPGGAIASLEFAVPPAAAWRAAWWGYTRMVLPVAGAVTGGREWYEVGRFLGPSITGHYDRYPLDWTIAAWQAAGIGDVEYRRMSLGGGLVMWGRRTGG
ncbi:MAG TPA: class I SAM-dependent methyltransferase [Acidimicrobiales bacterium]|nr:class I SAM-dependent methyltransferase [Acidimicrobiales bacterium]